MEYNYCRRCGDELQSINHEELRCGNSHSIYPAPAPGAGVILIDSLKRVYLARRAIEPDKGRLDTIGGFMLPGETAEQAAVREVEEETGLTRDDYGPLHYLSTTAQGYDFQGENRHVLSINFWAQLHDPEVKMTPNDDVAAIERLPIDEIDASHLSGQNGQLILARIQQIIDQLTD